MRLAKLIFLLLLWPGALLASDMVIQLKFPSVGNKKMTVPGAIAAAEAISGNILLDISPYPVEIEPGRYSVEYFLNGQLLYSTGGLDEENAEAYSFKYLFDTTTFADGNYRLVVNFYDNQAPMMGVGIKEVAIDNNDD